MQKLSKIAKLITPVITALVFLTAILVFINSQHRSQAEVQNHTQTLQQISQAVNQIKANNQINHDTTIKYIQCVLDTSIAAQQQPITKDTFNTCLKNSGVVNVDN